MTIITFAVITLILSTLYYRWFYSYWKSKNVQTLPPNILFGNLTDVVLRRVPTYDMFKKTYQTCISNGYHYMGYYFFGKPILIVTHPDLLKHILIKDFSNFCNREFYLNKKDEPLSAHLISMRGEEWKHMRGLISPAFTISKLKNLYPILMSVGDKLKSVLDEKQTWNVRDVIGKFVFDSVSSCSFGLEVNTLKNENLEIKNYAQRVSGSSLSEQFKVFLCHLNPNILHYLGIPFTSRDIQNFFFNLTKETVEYREKNNIIKKDLMHLLIQLRNNIGIDEKAVVSDKNNPKALTIEEIAAETLIFFAAGYETTATTTTNCIHELLCNESVQNKVRVEVEKVIGKYNGEITYDGLSEMTYLDMVVTETIRMHPVIPLISRVSTDNYKIPNSDVTIDKGTIIFVPVRDIQHDPNYFIQPEKFIPERFEPGSEFQTNPPLTFLGFGEGPRNCIGGRFGILMIKTVLAMILHQYSISVNNKTKLPLQLNKNNLIMSFDKPLFVDFCKIKK